MQAAMVRFSTVTSWFCMQRWSQSSNDET